MYFYSDLTFVQANMSSIQIYLDDNHHSVSFIAPAQNFQCLLKGGVSRLNDGVSPETLNDAENYKERVHISVHFESRRRKSSEVISPFCMIFQ